MLILSEVNSLFNMESLIAEIEQEIIKLRADLVKDNILMCSHVICDICKLAIENEAKEKLNIQAMINEKNNFLEKLKQYGSN